MEKILPIQIKIEQIKKEHHLLSFQSKEEDLQAFLIEDALHHQQQNISVTFLWFHQDQLVSYISLLTDRILLKADFKAFFAYNRINYNTLPALKVGRLCVDDRYIRRGLGRLMIYFAVEKAREISKNSAGCRFITVDSKRNSLGFYEKLGFTVLKEKTYTTLCLDIMNFNQYN